MNSVREAATKAAKGSKGMNLYQVLQSLPNSGVGSRVAPRMFIDKEALKNSYYEVTKVKLKPDTNHGRAWGVKVIKGRTMEDGKPIEIRGGLKFQWQSLSEEAASAQE